jgi:hypothetical protein
VARPAQGSSPGQGGKGVEVDGARAALKGDKNVYKVSRDQERVSEGDSNTSSWNKCDSLLPEDIVETEENPFSRRQVGVSKRVQEERQKKADQYWTGGKKCPGCGDGFVKKSKVVTCKECSWFAHKRSTCMTMGEDNTVICGNCKPIQSKTKNTKTISEENFKCPVCQQMFGSKFNMKRHIIRKHDGNTDPVEEGEAVENSNEESINIPDLKKILSEAKLEDKAGRFDEEGIEIEDILRMNEDDIEKLLKRCGIKRFGDQFRLLEQIRKLKNVATAKDTTRNKSKEDSIENVEDEEDSIEDVEDSIENEEGVENEDVETVKDTTGPNEDEIEDDIEDNIWRNIANIICKYCGKTARNEDALNSHMNSVHKIPCVEELCNLEFTSVDEYEIHLRSHLSPRPVRKRKAVQVEDEEDIDQDDSVVDKSYTPKDAEEDAEDDYEDLEYKCKYCPMSFDWEKLLKNHIDWQHALEKKKRPRMEKKKTYIDIAKLVEKALPASKPNTSTKLCKECGKSFAQGWNLSRHMTRVHK